MKTMRWVLLVGSAVLACWLVGCGGGGDFSKNAPPGDATTGTGGGSDAPVGPDVADCNFSPPPNGSRCMYFPANLQKLYLCNEIKTVRRGCEQWDGNAYCCE